MSAVLNPAVAAPTTRALRFLTAGSVDDGKSTLIGRLLFDSRAILADQLDTLETQAPAGAADRPVAAHRRPGGRARTGHHDRRGLPLLRHPRAQVHHRRRAGPRAVHAQHGHRRRRQRRRGGAGRRHQARLADPARGAAGADAAPRAAGAPAARAQHRVRGQQARRRATTPGTAFAAVQRGAARLCRRGRHRGRRPSCRCRRCAATTSRRPPWRMASWYDGPSLLQVLESLPAADESHDGPLPCRCSTSPAKATAPATSRARCGAASRRAACGPATRFRCSRAASGRRWSALRRAGEHVAEAAGRPVGRPGARPPARRLARRLDRRARHAGGHAALRRHAGLARHRARRHRPQVLGAPRQPLGAGAHQRDRAPARHPHAGAHRRARAGRQRDRPRGRRDAAAAAAASPTPTTASAAR